MTSILIVDDAPDWRKILSMLIAKTYPTVSISTAESYAEAEELVRQTDDIALVLLDIRLDERDENNREGLKLMQFIRLNYPHIHVIIMTGYADLDNVQTAMKPADNGYRAAENFIQKSNIHTELIPSIREIIVIED